MLYKLLPEYVYINETLKCYQLRMVEYSDLDWQLDLLTGSY